MRRRYKPILLSQASKILRAHSTQIDPPGLLEFQNSFLSRSDKSIGLRSDFEPAQEGMFSYSSLIAGSDQQDYLNAAFHVTRAGHTIWFGRWCPFLWSGGTFGQLFTLYEEGTISADGATSEVLGTGTEWLQKVWPGCLIRLKDDGANLYEILFVSNDTRLVTAEAMPVSSGAEYEIFRVHPSTRANWPIRLESLGGYLVYGTVDMEQPISEKYISGPFYSNISRPNLGVFFGTDPDVGELYIPINAISSGEAAQGSYGGLPLTAKLDMNALMLGGDKGAVFGRNWFGDKIWIYSWGSYALERETRVVPTGVQANITDLNKSTAITDDGQIITFGFGTEAVTLYGDYYQNSIYPDASVLSRVQPFGKKMLHAIVGSYFIGDYGLLGIVNGTTYTTGVNVALRAGCTYKKGYSGSTYVVIVGDADAIDGVVLTFTNPASITRQTTGTSESFTGVAYSVYHDRLCAVGTNGLCMTSDDDGVTWVSRTIGTIEDLNAIVADREGRCFCAVGNLSYGDAQCWLSMDGITWQQVTASEFAAEDLIDVEFKVIDGAFYVASKSGRVYRIRRRLYYDDPTVIGTWGTNSDYVTDLQNFDFGGFRFFFAVGSKIWSGAGSPPVWTERVATPAAPLFSVAFDLNGLTTLVAVGVGGTIYTSTNSGVTWTQQTSGTTEDLLGVIYHYIEGSGQPGDFIAYGKNGTVLRSADGLSWSPMAFPTTNNIECMTSCGTNTTSTQVNLYAFTFDGKLYVNRKNFTTYDGWQETDRDLEDLAYYQDTESRYVSGSYEEYRGPTNPSIRRMQGSAVYNALGLTQPAHHRLLSTTWNTIYAYDNLDRNFQGAVFYSRIVAGEYYVAFSTAPRYVERSNIWGHNAFAIDDRTSYTPTIVRRIASRAYKAHYGDSFTTLPAFDGYTVSTDSGATWSGVRLPNTLSFSLHMMTNYYPDVPWITVTQFDPICSDGTDFWLVQSSNRISAKPRLLQMDTMLLGYFIEEVAE